MTDFYRYRSKNTDNYKHTDFKGLIDMISIRLETMLSSSDRLGSDEIDELIDIVRTVKELKIVRG